MAWHHEQNERVAELIYEGLQIKNLPTMVEPQKEVWENGGSTKVDR